MKELRFFALEGVANELENPSNGKQDAGVDPHSMQENAYEEKCERKKNDWDAERVADSVYRVLMAGGILGDPLLIGAVA